MSVLRGSRLTLTRGRGVDPLAEIVSGSGATDPLDLAFAGQVLTGAVSETSLTEISGISRSNKSSDFFWAIEDSGASAVMHAMLWGGVYLQSVAVTGASNTDWEEMANASVGGNDYIYIFDFGNNAQGARTYNLYRVVEPDDADVLAGTATVAGGDVETITCEFGAGGTTTTPDIEAAVVDPDTGDIYIITKRIAGGPEVYRLDHAASYSGTQTLTYLGVIPGIPNDTTEGYTANAVSADARHDGQEVLIKTYTDVMRCARADGTTFEQMVMGTGGNSYVNDGIYGGHGNSFWEEPKGESVLYTPDGLNFVTISEIDGQGYPAYIYGYVRYEVAAVEFQEGVDSYAGTTDTYNDQALPLVNNESAIAFDIDSGPNARESFIHFGDIFAEVLGQIKASMTIRGGYLEIVVSDTGSGVEVFEMLTNWVPQAGTMTWMTNLFNGALGGGVVAGTDVAVNSQSGLGDPVTGDHVAAGTYRLALSAALLEKWRTINFGLALLPRYPDGDSGLGAHTSEAASSANRPKLVIHADPDPEAPETVSVQQGLDSYSGAEDSFFHQKAVADADTGADNSAAVSLISDKNASDERFTYLKWGGLDSVVPAGATVTSVEIDLYVNTEGQGIDCHEILTAIAATESWDDLDGRSWSPAQDGTDVGSAVVASWPGVDTYVGPITMASTAALVALVQGWVDNDSSNRGLLLVGSHASDGQQIDSAEGATQSRRPLLRITYTPLAS